MQEIPIINVGGLFANNDKKRKYIDRQIAKAAFDVGFMVIQGYPKDLKTTVNPIKTLTPRFIVRAVEKMKKKKKKEAK